MVAKRSRLIGGNWFHQDLAQEDPLWKKCVARWGTREGYVAEIASANDNWFSGHPGANERLSGMVEREWGTR